MLPYCSLPQNCNLLLNLCYGLLDSWSVSYISFFVFLVNDCGVIQGHSPSYCYYCTEPWLSFLHYSLPPTPYTSFHSFLLACLDGNYSVVCFSSPICFFFCLSVSCVPCSHWLSCIPLPSFGWSRWNKPGLC